MRVLAASEGLRIGGQSPSRSLARRYAHHVSTSSSGLPFWSAKQSVKSPPTVSIYIHAVHRLAGALGHHCIVGGPGD